MINSTIASTAFNQAGLDAMGQASGQLSARWVSGSATYDAAAMSLTSSSSFLAAVGGSFQWRAFGAPELLDVAGVGLSGVVAVLRFHPQAALRIRRLVGRRFDGRTDGRANRPVPFFAAIRGGDGPAELPEITEQDPPLAPDDALAGSELTHGTLTFHDEQGWIVDPVAVACLFRDLLRGFPALLKDGAGTVADLDTICAQATGVRLQVVDPFGGPWVDRAGRPGLRFGSGARLAGTLHDWVGETLQATEAGDLRFGFGPEGTLGAVALARPVLPTTPVPSGSSAPALERQHLRVVATHLGLHLLGNRSDAALDGVPAPDEATRLELDPVVRDGDSVEVLVDGLATTGSVAEIGGAAGLVLAVSPHLATDVAFPANRTARWPAVPATTGTAQDLTGEQSARIRAEGVAAWVGDTADVVLTWADGVMPREAHVRVFPRLDPGPAIVPLAELDFSRRADGGATVVRGEAAVLLVDPFRAGGTPRPSAPRVRFDVAIVTRGPAGVRGRLLGGLELPVGTGGVAPPRPAVTNPLDAVPLDQRGLSPAPILGLTPTVPATGTDPVLAALGEAAPREAPRFRTMARTESVVAGHDGGSPGAWTAVLTPGFLDARSVRGDARLANPGHDGGPEDHAPGIRATGRLALDLARAALRRTHHLVRRLPELDAGRWAEPTVAGTGTIAGAVLQNVAETCENPESALLLPESLVHSLPGDWNALVAALGSELGLPDLPEVPAPGSTDRWITEVHREVFAAEHGRRDAQWAWRWALSHARRLVYLETPLFGATGEGTDAHVVDLVQTLVARLGVAKDLRVVLALPKRVPFGPGYEAFAQRFHQLRNGAVAALEAAAPGRVAVYHPMGFPGRPEVIRGTVGVVDDVWALIGSSSFSRRGLTFDGSTDVVFTDRVLHDGVSVAIRDLRRRAMARTLGLSPTTGGATPSASYVRTRDPRAAFALVAEIVGRGGDGLVEPLWAGVSESEVLPVDRAIADPDGRAFSAVLGMYAELLAGLGPARV